MWYYNGEMFDPLYEDLARWAGFVYLVTNTDTQQKYIGKKTFHRQTWLPANKSRKRRKKVLRESDWRSYAGSSPEVLQLVEDHGVRLFDRKILHLCESKGMMSYLEAKEQFDRDVLLDDTYYNAIIQCRIHRRHVISSK